MQPVGDMVLQCNTFRMLASVLLQWPVLVTHAAFLDFFFFTSTLHNILFKHWLLFYITIDWLKQWSVMRDK